jgi:hypothetical protein
MPGWCGRCERWLAKRLAALICPSAVVWATRTSKSGRAERNPMLMRAIEHSARTHKLGVCGHVELQTSADECLSNHFPTPPLR